MTKKKATVSAGAGGAAAMEMPAQQDAPADAQVAAAAAAVDALDGESVGYVEIEKLSTQGINAADITKLKSGGCQTVQSVLMRTKKDLVEIKGLSDAKIEKIVEAARKLMVSGFITGTELRDRRKLVQRVTTGSREFDALLGGGIETQSITEVYGEYRTGKTQLCLTLCIAAQLPATHGGANGKVAFIDTEGTFRPERIAPIAERFGLDAEAALDNIIYARAFTSEHQDALITEVAARMVEDQFAMLIVDSLMALFRVDYTGRGELSERQQKLGRLLSKLVKIAEEFNVAVVVVNQVMSDPAGGTFAGANEKKPIGGHVVAHASTTRIALRKGRGEQRIAKIVDSPLMPEADATFALSNGGIVDAND